MTFQLIIYLIPLTTTNKGVSLQKNLLTEQIREQIHNDDDNDDDDRKYSFIHKERLFQLDTTKINVE